MQPVYVACLLLTGISLGQAPATRADYYPPIVSAGRDLQYQIDFLMRALATLPGRPEGRGFSKETMRIVIDLTTFRNQAQQKLSRAELYVSFAPVDREVNQLVSELQNFGKYDPAIRLAARRTQSALNEVHLALTAGDPNVKHRPLNEARQIQTLANRAADLESLAGLLLTDPDRLKTWNADFAELRSAIAELQRLQTKQAARDDVKQQLVKSDKIWEKLVTRFKAFPADQALALREDFGQVDQVFARLSTMFDIPNRRAPLRVHFLP